MKFTSTDDYTIISMVEQGLGISVLPKLVLEGYKHCKIQTLNLEPPCIRNLGIALPSIKKRYQQQKIYRIFPTNCF